MKTGLESTEYYIGLDCGTESVGFAVTDLNYNILKFNGKSMWGSHLFDEAKTAEGRRGARCARRRRQREIQRISLLQEIFAEEVYKVDPTFFIRLNDSNLNPEDKSFPDRNIVFNDPTFKDKDYFKLYPTAYHLRRALMRDEITDPRLLYLGIHHILKHRGHFLFPGENLQAVNDLGALVLNVQKACSAIDISLSFSSSEELESALRIKGNSRKLEELANVISSEDSKFLKNVMRVLVGYKVNAEKLFGNEEYKDLNIEFKKQSFEDEDLPALEDALNEDEFQIVYNLKAMYDWALLCDVMGGYAYISDAKISLFDQNRKDLKLLKSLVRKYTPDSYDSFFHSGDVGMFSSYVGKIHDRSKSREKRVEKCKTEDFYKSVEKLLKRMDPEDKDVKAIEEAIGNDAFLPLLSSFRNGIVPYQVNYFELNAILDKAKCSFTFLNNVDEEGLSNIDKIKAIMKFRIPYYVGPLGRDSESSSCYSWMERREAGRILPWNLDKKVNIGKSAENFITRMTNKCTYCKDQDVLPKNSIAYSKYLVLSELNNLRIKDQRLSVERKQAVYENLFKKYSRVTKKRVLHFALSEGWYSKNELSIDDITGLESDFKSSLSSYLDFKPYIEAGKLKASDADLIIKWITVFSEGGDILTDRISKEFAGKLTSEDVKQISKLKYSGWGRFSNKFLYEIQDAHPETGEMMSIVRMMWNTQYNLMELLSDNFEFRSQTTGVEKVGKLEYSIVDDLYVSPSVKRQIWQTLRIVDEIQRIMKHSPKKVFIETTRSEGEKKRTISRRTDLIQKLKDAQKGDSEFSKDFRELLVALEGKTESQISIQDKLYLYFTQCGRCMYTMQPINLDDLYRTEIYDIDHIYPYSKSNDDSLVNKVLVLHSENLRKSADYPVSSSIRSKMLPFWNMLKDKGFISREKYDRLTRTTPLTDDDLKGFINRQLVETSQSIKASAEILKAFFGDDAKIVYSKARNVSEFRHDNGFIKCRTMNNLHHAKDAYLNIVVGNVLDTKYTKNYYMQLNGSGYGNLSEPFRFNVAGAWEAGRDGTIATVKKYMRKNDIRFTRQPILRNGQLYDLQIVPKGSKEGALPAKPSNPRLKQLVELKGREVAYSEWTAKYGGYNSLSTAYFALVKHKEKNKSFASFIPISMVDSRRLSSTEALRKYCVESLRLTDPVVLYPRLLINSVVEFDGFRFVIVGKASGGKQVTLESSVPLILSNEGEKTLKKIESFANKKKDYKNLTIESKFDGIDSENTLDLFHELMDKSKKAIYLNRPGSQGALLLNPATEDKFKSLDLESRVTVISELMKYYGMNNGMANLSSIGGTKACGTLIKGSKVNLEKTKLSLVFQSVTGLFEQRVEIS
jgi:CRISPR-associated endonuclease Csn1